MGFLESFLDALGRSGLLPEASGTLLDDRGGLKHHACNGLEAWKGSDITLVVFLMLLGQATSPSNPLSDRRRKALRSFIF